MQWLRSLAAFAALAVALLLGAEDADARLEGGPNLSQSTEGALLAPPLDAPALAVIAANDHVTAGSSSYPGGSLGGLFNRPGLLGGFAAGFLGSGVIGVLFGHGAIGELSGIASILGLMFQLTLLVMLARLIWTWWRDDTADAFANLSPRQLADAYGHMRHEVLPDVDSGPALDPAFDEAADDGLGRPK